MTLNRLLKLPKGTHNEIEIIKRQIEARASNGPVPFNVAVVLQRSPLILPQPSQFDTAFSRYMRAIYRSRSHSFSPSLFLPQESNIINVFNRFKRHIYRTRFSSPEDVKKKDAREREAKAAKSTKEQLDEYDKQIQNLELKEHELKALEKIENEHIMEFEEETLNTQEKIEEYAMLATMATEPSLVKTTELIDSEQQPTRTKADDENILTSLHRALDQSLYLIVKDTDSSKWKFPSVLHQGSESLAKSADPAIRPIIGSDIRYWLVSGTPICHHCEADEGNHANVEHTMFLRARLLHNPSGSTEAAITANKIPFAWVTRTELESYLEPRLYDKLLGSLPL